MCIKTFWAKTKDSILETEQMRYLLSLVSE